MATYLETHRAHCGACAGLMVLQFDTAGFWFVCVNCWLETTKRPTAAEADEDVVWVPVTTPAKKE